MHQIAKIKILIDTVVDQPMTDPKVGLSMLFCLGEPFKKMTERLVEADTAHIELVDEGFHTLNIKRVRILNELAASHGFKYTVHAPFADVNIASPSKTILNAILKRLKRSIVYANALDAKVWVFHPGLRTGVSSFYPGMDWIQNQKTACLLFEFARNHGMSATIENVPEPFPFIVKSVEDFEKFYSEASEDIKLAFDIGHANINGQTERFMTTFSDKIAHIHAHDNHGKSDQHLGIGYGTTNWQKVADLVRNISYNKVIIIESVEHVKESMDRMKRLLA